MTGEITLSRQSASCGWHQGEDIGSQTCRNQGNHHECRENKKNIDEIQDIYLKGLTFHYVNDIKKVFAIALTNEKVRMLLIYPLRNPARNDI